MYFVITKYKYFRADSASLTAKRGAVKTDPKASKTRENALQATPRPGGYLRTPEARAWLQTRCSASQRPTQRGGLDRPQGGQKSPPTKK